MLINKQRTNSQWLSFLVTVEIKQTNRKLKKLLWHSLRIIKIKSNQHLFYCSFEKYIQQTFLTIAIPIIPGKTCIWRLIQNRDTVSKPQQTPITPDVLPCAFVKLLALALDIDYCVELQVLQFISSVKNRSGLLDVK